MRVKEFAYLDEQIKLWNQFNRPMLNSISDENFLQVQKPLKIEKFTKKVSGKQAAVPRRKPTKSPKQFKSTARSNPATPQHQSTSSQSQTSANTLHKRPMRQKHDPNSVASIQRQLYPLANNDVVKRLTH